MTLEALFNPQSVAVVGASRDKGKVGHQVLVHLIRGGYEGAIYPINPKAEAIEGLRCYPDLESIGAAPDLAVIMVRPRHVLGVVRGCAKVGVKAAVILTSGFAETGQAGKRCEEELVAIARAAGIQVLGPNCLGLMSVGHKLNACFGGEMPPRGGIGYFSQSGSLLAVILDLASTHRIGFSKLVSMGNKADIDELDLMRALGEDPQTTVIAGYLESISDGDAFVREAERISRQKPILLVKSGETGAGARAATSHTGSLVRPELAFECVAARAGIVRCGSIKAQFELAQAFATQPLPQGTAVAVVGNGGGLGIMAVDAIERQGLRLATLSEATVRALEAHLPVAASKANPVDLLGDALADRFEFALRAVLDDRNVQTVLLLVSPHAMTPCTRIADMTVRVSRARPGKPVLACFLGGRRVAEAIGVLQEGRVPQYDSPEAAIRAVRAMADYARWRSRPERVVRLFAVDRRKVEEIIARHVRSRVEDIGETEAMAILEAYGFATPKGALATSAAEAVRMAEEIGYPVVLKIWSPDILHKSDVGGVQTNLRRAEEVGDAFGLMMDRIPRRMPEAEIRGVYVQEMCRAGREVVLGTHRDPRFGPLMMCGMGGVFVEVLRDVAFHLAPVTAQEALEMLRSTRTYQLLAGTHGTEGADIDAVAEGIQRLSQLVTEFPQIQEMDINPYVVGPKGTTPVAVDARIRVAEPE